MSSRNLARNKEVQKILGRKIRRTDSQRSFLSGTDDSLRGTGELAGIRAPREHQGYELGRLSQAELQVCVKKNGVILQWPLL